MKKNRIFLMTLIMLAFALVGCSSEAETSTNGSSETPAPVEENLVEERVFTLEELKAYNGKEGSPAYIAVNGMVYDVSNSSRWRDGNHNGFDAGQDLTDALYNDSPHGDRTLANVPVVGRIEE